MLSKLKNITLSVTVLLVTIIVTGKDIFSEDDAKVIVKKTINLCKEDNNKFTFTINIGEVKTTDSLFGFDIELSYDPKKIRIISALTGNTLSETFEERNFSFGYENDKVKGYATTMQVNIVPPSGNKDLIAFYAEWIGNNKCADSSKIEIIRLEFTDEFKKNITKYEHGVVYTNYTPIEGNSILVNTDKSVYNIGTGETKIKMMMTVTKPQLSKTNSFKIQFDDSKVIKLREIKNIDNNSKISSVGDNYFTLEFINSAMTANYQIIYDYILRDTISNYVFGISSIEYTDCSCIYDYSAQKVIINKDSIFTSVLSDNDINFDCVNNTLRVNNAKVTNIRFVDILGRDLGDYVINEPTTINLNNIPTNVIFGIINRSNNYEIKRFYKCY